MKITVIEEYGNPELIDSPCGCIRSEKLIIINPVLFYAMPDFDQRFWLKHEEGHIVLNTNNEFACDKYAFDAIVGTEYRSLKQMIAAVEALLTSSWSEHKMRKQALIDMCYEWDSKN